MDEEAPTDYGKGGYLRVALGDRLGPDSRYEIKRKLGWGVFSTVWLAEDLSSHKHVALKICRSDRETKETAEAEVSVLKETIWNGQCQDNLVRLIDYFYHPAQGPSRGEHACLVFEILGPNLLSFLEAHVETVRLRKGDAVPGEAGGLPLSLVKEFAKQMLAGIAYLHDFCRHIHTDLKPENIAITLPDIERVIKQSLSTTTPSSTLVETARQNSHSATPQVVEIYESQPLPTPIYRLTTPRCSSDDELSAPAPLSVASSCNGDVSASGSSNGGNASATPHDDHSPRHRASVSISASSTVATSAPISIASSSSPIATTLASFSRRLSSSFSSISFSAWPFTRSPPVREPMAGLRSPLEETMEEITLEQESRRRHRVREKKLPDLGLKIVDFGNAQPVSEVYYGRIQTRQYRAPEVILGRRDWDRKVDVWSVACIIFELATGDYLFDPPEDSKNRDQDHIYQILELTNPFYDRRWAMGGRQSGKIFNPSGDPERRLHYRTLQQLLEEKYHLESSEAKGMAEFLLPMLAFEPRYRANARDLADHPWLAGTKPTQPFPPDEFEMHETTADNF